MSILEYTKADVEQIRASAIEQIKHSEKYKALFEKIVADWQKDIEDIRCKAAMYLESGQAKVYEYYMKEYIPSMEHSINTVKSSIIDCALDIKKYQDRIIKYDELLREGNLPSKYSYN